MKPKYPIYVPSKGRWESRLTSKALDKMGVPYHLVVQAPEYSRYADAVGDPTKLLVLPEEYTKPAAEGGLVAARNFIYEHAIESGAERHWQIDDNIRGFFRFHYNVKAPFADGTCFRIIEDFCDRYENVAQGGMQYYMFVPRKVKFPPFYLNCRIYSCTLNSHAHDERYRGVYNDDTDISLRLLKQGWATVLFNAILAFKVATMIVSGGNTEIYKQGEAQVGTAGRLDMAQELADQHPDVVRVVKKFQRYQHQVDYRPFKANFLRPKPGLVIPDGSDEYGLVFQELDQATGQWVTKHPAEPMRRWYPEAPR